MGECSWAREDWMSYSYGGDMVEEVEDPYSLDLCGIF